MPWTQLSSLSLHGNPWRCDCSLVYLTEVVRMMEAARAAEEENDGNSAIAFAAGVGKCAEPAEYRHRLLTEVELGNELRCADGGGGGGKGDMIRHEPMMEGGGKASGQSPLVPKATVVLVVAVAASLLLCSLLALLAVRYGSRAREWAKSSSWSPAQWLGLGRGRLPEHVPYKGSTLVAGSLHATPSHHQYSSSGSGSHHYSQTSSSGGSGSALYQPHLQQQQPPQQQQQHVDPYVRQEYRRPSYALDDEHYYYVATLQNRMAQGKHIPVTEL